MQRLITSLAALALATPAFATETIAYFAHDSAELRPEHTLIAEQAAVYARRPEITEVRVIGRADTSGPAAYNLALSRRRAARFAAELVRHGVDPKKIVVEGRGEGELSVITPDGVREPLNRIVYAQFSF